MLVNILLGVFVLINYDHNIYMALVHSSKIVKTFVFANIDSRLGL
jgi:hypothetical protein